MALMVGKWAPVPGQIMTRWATDVDPDAPLPEYPRPQMVRPDWLSLNGLWSFSVQPAQEQTPIFEAGSRILVPFTIESALSGVKRALLPSERLWYRRSFRVPSEWAGRRILLHFGAVDFQTEVQVNGRAVGTHEGGNNPFKFDITDELTTDDNELIVSVAEPGPKGSAPTRSIFMITVVDQVSPWLTPRSVNSPRISRGTSRT